MKLKPFSVFAIATLGITAAGVFITPHRLVALEHSPHHGSMPGMMHPGDSAMMPMHIASEFEFLSQMIPHHEEAIVTAQEVLDRSDRPEMREFAQEIINVQSAEIEQMQAWLAEWYPNEVGSQTYTPMMRNLDDLTGEALDQAFLKDMIMHHMHAVMMSRMLIHHGLVEHEPVEPFAEAIAQTQRQEIRQMHTWLQDWYNIGDLPNHQEHRQNCMRSMGRMHEADTMPGHPMMH